MYIIHIKFFFQQELIMVLLLVHIILLHIVHYFNPIICNRFGLGDISKLSFLEFIEFIQRRLINARTRKTISDFKGGWYPALLNVYIQYLERGLLATNRPITFKWLYFCKLISILEQIQCILPEIC